MPVGRRATGGTGVLVRNPPLVPYARAQTELAHWPDWAMTRFQDAYAAKSGQTDRPPQQRGRARSRGRQCSSPWRRAGGRRHPVGSIPATKREARERSHHASCLRYSDPVRDRSGAVVGRTHRRLPPRDHGRDDLGRGARAPTRPGARARGMPGRGRDRDRHSWELLTGWPRAVAHPRLPVTVGMRIAAHPPRRSGRGR